MKLISLTFFVILLSTFSFGQVIEGDVKNEGRELISDSKFVIEGSKSGFIYYELTVDREGNVTAANLLTDKTTVNSTPSKMKAKSHVLKFKFTAGTMYPKFQTVIVKITSVKPK